MSGIFASNAERFPLLSSVSSRRTWPKIGMAFVAGIVSAGIAGAVLKTEREAPRAAAPETAKLVQKKKADDKQAAASKTEERQVAAAGQPVRVIRPDLVPAPVPSGEVAISESAANASAPAKAEPSLPATATAGQPNSVAVSTVALPKSAPLPPVRPAAVEIATADAADAESTTGELAARDEERAQPLPSLRRSRRAERAERHALGRTERMEARQEEGELRRDERGRRGRAEPEWRRGREEREARRGGEERELRRGRDEREARREGRTDDRDRRIDAMLEARGFRAVGQRVLPDGRRVTVYRADPESRPIRGLSAYSEPRRRAFFDFF